MPSTAHSLTVTHGNGAGGCEILKQCHIRDVNFFTDKSRIFITFRGMEEIFSNIVQTLAFIFILGEI
jgi:hypothetical protein